MGVHLAYAMAHAALAAQQRQAADADAAGVPAHGRLPLTDAHYAAMTKHVIHLGAPGLTRSSSAPHLRAPWEVADAESVPVPRSRAAARAMSTIDRTDNGPASDRARSTAANAAGSAHPDDGSSVGEEEPSSGGKGKAKTKAKGKARSKKIKGKTVIVDVAPLVFARLRTRWRVPVPAYVDSLISSPLLGGSTGAGKSGMLFFRTWDNKYIIKTVASSELSFFRKHLHDYYRHMVMCDNSLLTRFFGLYKIKVKSETVRVVVMNNVFHTPLRVREVYDLKGSTKDRLVTQKQIIEGEKVLKDLNLKRRLHVGPGVKELLLDQLDRDSALLADHGIMDYSLLLGIYTPAPAATVSPSARLSSASSSSSCSSSSSSSCSSSSSSNRGSARLVLDSSTTSDASELSSSSTLGSSSGSASATLPPVSAVPPPPPLPPPPPFRSAFQTYLGGIRSEDPSDPRPLDEREVYFVGVIDIMQEYNLIKKLEHAYKVKSAKRSTKAGRLTLEKAVLSSDLVFTPETTDETAMSAIEPHAYRTRFMDFMRAIITDDVPTSEEIAALRSEALARAEQKRLIDRQRKINRQLRRSTPRIHARPVSTVAFALPAVDPALESDPASGLDPRTASSSAAIDDDDLFASGACNEDDLASMIESEIADANPSLAPNAFAFGLMSAVATSMARTAKSPRSTTSASVPAPVPAPASTSTSKTS
ncbi:uncharacterized protein AMSG_00219 [Thecamonas trahens ATCC 50062]|uniref:PIPK domain-containing protein n=1 Tax=Thecamonas trahens ATCC 50062 TaxID=461836 RepID=A0A0L0D1I6_THETB|nr:hypothetical protein AMSG_00219 [Thecamonas trahens ATCC 50062]KNC46102.1 hypothetical protein AMSG_00219 [Thecamonas trahens ATCC 50062]|eukprot:XP_013763080.1 hypothetical protein AMSG_00219 [Thecamonas trahens ATCC 50062]